MFNKYQMVLIWHPMQVVFSLQENIDIFPENNLEKFREYFWKIYFNIVNKF